MRTLGELWVFRILHWKYVCLVFTVYQSKGDPDLSFSIQVFLTVVSNNVRCILWSLKMWHFGLALEETHHPKKVCLYPDTKFEIFVLGELNECVLYGNQKIISDNTNIDKGDILIELKMLRMTSLLIVHIKYGSGFLNLSCRVSILCFVIRGHVGELSEFLFFFSAWQRETLWCYGMELSGLFSYAPSSAGRNNKWSLIG